MAFFNEMAYQQIGTSRVWIGSSDDTAPASPTDGDIVVELDSRDINIYHSEMGWKQVGTIVVDTATAMTLGDRMDTAITNPESTATLIALLKGLLTVVAEIKVVLEGTINVDIV